MRALTMFSTLRDGIVATEASDETSDAGPHMCSGGLLALHFIKLLRTYHTNDAALPMVNQPMTAPNVE